MSLYLGDQIISGQATLVGESRNIGQIIPSAIPLTDAGLHLLDGALIQGSGIYSAFVTYIAGLVSTYPNLFVTESAWQSAVTTYGVCGKFVYDSTNNTVRLPKITGIVEGTTDLTALGDLIQAGLPQHTHTRGSMNITGTFQLVGGSGGNGTQTGAFYLAQTSTGYQHGPDGTKANPVTGFDASRSWIGSTSNANYTSTVNTSSTVQPQTIRVLYYIVLATSTKTDIEVDIDNVVSDLNGKADRDYSNATYQPVNKAGDSMSGSLSLLRLICNGNGLNNNFDFQHTSKPNGGWYLNADRLSDGTWAEIMPIIDRYSNGTSWYRVWSDKWCEQGGQAQINSEGQTVTLLKNFANTNYYVGANGLQTQRFVSCYTKTTSNFKVYTGDDNSFNSSSICWQACGYIN